MSHQPPNLGPEVPTRAGPVPTLPNNVLDVEAPPIRGKAKTAAVDIISLLGGGTLAVAAVELGVKKTLLYTALGAKIGLFGHGIKGVVGFNLPFYFGPVNELVERLTAMAAMHSHLPRPERPLLDLEAPARNLYTILSFIPGISESFSALNAKILQRDFDAHVQDQLDKVRTLQGLFPNVQDQAEKLKAYQDYFHLLIEGGARPGPLVQGINDIQFVLDVNDQQAQILLEFALFAFGIGVDSVDRHLQEQAAKIALRVLANTGVFPFMFNPSNFAGDP